MIDDLNLDNFVIDRKRNDDEYTEVKLPDDFKIDSMLPYGVLLLNLKKSDLANIEASIQDHVNKKLRNPPYEKQSSDDLITQIDKLENELVTLQKQSNKKDKKIIKQNEKINQLHSLISPHFDPSPAWVVNY